MLAINDTNAYIALEYLLSMVSDVFNTGFQFTPKSQLYQNGSQTLFTSD